MFKNTIEGRSCTDSVGTVTREGIALAHRWDLVRGLPCEGTVHWREGRGWGTAPWHFLESCVSACELGNPSTDVGCGSTEKVLQFPSLWIYFSSRLLCYWPSVLCRTDPVRARRWAPVFTPVFFLVAEGRCFFPQGCLSLLDIPCAFVSSRRSRELCFQQKGKENSVLVRSQLSTLSRHLRL